MSLWCQKWWIIWSICHSGDITLFMFHCFVDRIPINPLYVAYPTWISTHNTHLRVFQQCFPTNFCIPFFISSVRAITPSAFLNIAFAIKSPNATIVVSFPILVVCASTFIGSLAHSYLFLKKVFTFSATYIICSSPNEGLTGKVINFHHKFSVTSNSFRLYFCNPSLRCNGT